MVAVIVIGCNLLGITGAKKGPLMVVWDYFGDKEIPDGGTVAITAVVGVEHYEGYYSYRWNEDTQQYEWVYVEEEWWEVYHTDPSTFTFEIVNNGKGKEAELVLTGNPLVDLEVTKPTFDETDPYYYYYTLYNYSPFYVVDTWLRYTPRIDPGERSDGVKIVFRLGWLFSEVDAAMYDKIKGGFRAEVSVPNNSTNAPEYKFILEVDLEIKTLEEYIEYLESKGIQFEPRTAPGMRNGPLLD